MSKPRICKTCKWLHHRVEPCCWCLRWGKGKTDYYTPAEETLGEYLERKEREAMKYFSTDQLIRALRNNRSSEGSLKKIAAARLEQLQQELIDERDRYDRLVSFELAEAEELRAEKKFAASCAFKAFFADTVRPSIGVCPSSDGCAASFSPKGRSQSEEVTPPAGGYASSTADERDDTVRRCAEYIAEKHLQMEEEPPDQQAKADAGKPQLCMVPRQIIRDIAEVREYGNRKYGDPENWRTVSVERYRNAAFRHWLAYLDDPAGVDAESGISHLKHLACNIAFLCELEGAY